MAAGRVEDPIDNLNALKEEDAESVVDPVQDHALFLETFGAIIVTDQDMLKRYVIKNYVGGFRMAG